MKKCNICNENELNDEEVENQFSVCENCKNEMESHSSCCSTSIYPDTDICSSCKDHCDTAWDSYIQELK